MLRTKNTTLLTKDDKKADIVCEYNARGCIIPVYGGGSYGVTTTVITFNKKWTNDRIKTWLYQNDYPIKSERIPVCTDYDCSGQIYYVGFNLKNQIATITEHRDV